MPLMDVPHADWQGPRFNGDRDLNRIYGEVLLEEGKVR